jgi:hypothetical protein
VVTPTLRSLRTVGLELTVPRSPVLGEISESTTTRINISDMIVASREPRTLVLPGYIQARVPGSTLRHSHELAKEFQKGK